MIDEAEALLADAARAGTPGRFQLEAAIQSAHAHRAVTGQSDWEAIVLLYRALLELAPTVGALVGHAAAVAEARGAAAGVLALDALDAAMVAQYQPYWALRAHVMGRLGRTAEAQLAYTRAIGLSEDPAARAFLARRAAALRSG
jgi:RNA polymerase sigma-70 factor (ECF subfamily)